jgi:hypothetical protein
MQFSAAAAVVGTAICAIGLATSFFLTEPKPESLEQ